MMLVMVTLNDVCDVKLLLGYLVLYQVQEVVVFEGIGGKLRNDCDCCLLFLDSVGKCLKKVACV